MPTASSGSSAQAQNSDSRGDRSANSTPTQSRISSRSGTKTEPTSVKDRILAWQEHGSGVAVDARSSDGNSASDLSKGVNCGQYLENPDELYLTRTPRGKREAVRGDSTPRHKKSKWVDPSNSQWVRTASRSTPRKRVVSDEHWKKKTPNIKPINNLTRKSHVSGERDDNALGRTLHAPEIELTERDRLQKDRAARRAKLKAERHREVYGNIEQSSIEIPETPHGEFKQEDIHSAEDRELDGNTDTVKDTPTKSGKRPLSSGLRYSHEIPAEKDDGRHRRRSSDSGSRNGDFRTAGSTFQDRLANTKARKNGILGHVLDESRKMFAKPDLGSPSPRIPSIEAWLEETPDPFLDEKSNEDPPVEMPAPLKTKSRRHRSEAAEIDERPTEQEKNSHDAVPEEVALGSGSRRRRKRRSRSLDEDAPPVPSPRPASKMPSPEEASHGQGSEEQSPPSLRRSSARAHRRRRAKSTPMQQTSASTQRMQDLDPPPPSNEDDGGLNVSKMPLRSKKVCPRTGAQRLSTIASVETFHTQKRRSPAISDDMAGELNSVSHGLKRKLTTHEDLMSVLSLPRAGKNVRSSKSVHSSRVARDEITSVELLHDLAIEEAGYMRELKTLVDGVVPVLLHCVLSRSDSAIAAGLFTTPGSPDDDLRVTQPIYDMGVCLGRIESLHKRMPLQDAHSLLTWAKGADKVYSEYFKVWRTGFQDVVVNLTPADDETKSKTDGDMSRDENGDIVNEKGEKADVAFLLKRPLVRVKKLSRCFSKLCSAMPSSKATEISEMFLDLTALARRRSNEEQGRQEDLAAMRIDVQRTRSLQTMTMAQDVTIDKSYSVRARDEFSLTLHHSSGQRYDCQVELLLRDHSNAATGGDLLICELDNTEKWLLFPPAETANISARKGDLPGEIILMVRFSEATMSEGHELLLLQAETEEASSEWIQMLGSTPLPPKLRRSHSSISHSLQLFEPTIREPDVDFATSSVLSRKEIPSPKDVDAPIGEQTTSYSQTQSARLGVARSHADTAPNASALGRNSFADIEAWVSNELSELPSKPSYVPMDTTESSKTIRGNPKQTTHSSSNPLRRSRVISRRTKEGDGYLSSPTSDGSPSRHPSELNIRGAVSVDQQEPVLSRSSATSTANERGKEHTVQTTPSKPSAPDRPHFHRTPSSTPSADLPSIPRLRPSNQYNDPPSYDTEQIGRSGGSIEEPGPHKSPKRPVEVLSDNVYASDRPISPRHQSNRIGSPLASPLSPKPPQPPPHRSPMSSRSNISTPQAQKSPLLGRNADRRSSSPLKHEYAPSTASDSTLDSGSSYDESSSDTSDDEAEDMHTPLPSLPLRVSNKPSSPSSVPTLASASLAPSNSASQAPYRTVPPQTRGPKSKSIATIYSWSDRGMWTTLHSDECSIIVTPGLISAYQMSAAHSGSKPVVNPKTISETTSDTSSYLHEDEEVGKSPLIALELTPLVPIRRGTALDISIRSPPTSDSKIRSSNNIMFRSRSADECEALYNLINYARINNPTYIALQNARPPVQPPVNFNINGQGSRTGAASRTGSWLFGRGGSRKGPSSFRASSAPPPGSITAASENSLANSFSSAMRRFSSSNMFSLNRSSVVRKSYGAGTPSLQSTESGTTTTGGSGSGTTSPAPNQLVLNVAGGAEKTLGINNIKIRLYTRDQPGQPWTHLGPARLSVLPATDNPSQTPRGGGLNSNGPSPPPTSAGFSGSRPSSSADVMQSDYSDPQRTPRASAQRGPRLPSSSYTPHRKHGDGREKRVLIVAKSKSKTKAPAVLIDECLGESCFNRIGRIGMAISVWEEEMEMKKVGGVVTGKDKIYMVQFHGEAEAAWVFGSVGRIRF
ncbi:MAG: hypothetical protein Q9160_006833 [Pyrenula sp. 1 TL-2023]